MDIAQEEMQFLGILGICGQSFKLIFSHRKIFSQITLALIVPLSLIFLAHIQISNVLFSNILNKANELDDTPREDDRYHRLHRSFSSQLVYFCLFKLAYFIALLVFSLLSTAAVVFTVATIYTAGELTFKKVMRVVPNVWKRLIITFLCTFLAFLLYNVVMALILVLWYFTAAPTQAALPTLIIIAILYACGFVYLTVVWQLASVVSVLEDSKGFKAMVKSKNLIKGKAWVAIAIFLMLIVCLIGIEAIFELLVVHGGEFGVVGRVGFGAICCLLMFKLVLFGLVVQTVIYFVCKSYHHESIDRSSLSTHLEVYLGDYVRLRAKDVQLERVNNV
ncbi:hypothetical protein NMG60_11017163 [Bertholletia excelsa]